MKLKFDVTNGWRFAPHCWKHYLLRPLRFEKTPVWVCISVVGFAIFIYWSAEGRMDA